MSVAVPGRRLVILGLLPLLLVSCGEDGPHTTAPDAATGSAAPVVVDLAVDGYKVVTAGTGTARQIWGNDSDGTHEPFTALRRRGVAGLDGVVLVAVTGFAGQEGGLHQSSFGSYERGVPFTVDGREAIYSPPDLTGRGRTWSDLVVAVGDDLAVRVTTAEASQEELVEWYHRVEPHGRASPPSVDTGDDLEVIGTVDADAAIASQADAVPNSDEVPGPESAYGIGWRSKGADRGSLALVAMPGDSADLDALAVGQMVLGWRQPTIELAERDGVRHLVVEEGDPERPWHTRSIWMVAANGDLLLARAEGEQLPTRELLFGLLKGAQPTDDAAWEALVIEATGGPGLHPDEGREELARGTVGDVEWLLQTGPLELIGLIEDEAGLGDIGVDPCLKLSNRRRACGGGGGGSSHDWIFSTPDSEEPVPPFIVLSTTLEAAAVRVTTNADQVTAPLHQVPGHPIWGTVVFIDDPGLGECFDQPPTSRPDTIPPMRVDALDADGNVVGCLGMGIEAYRPPL